MDMLRRLISCPIIIIIIIIINANVCGAVIMAEPLQQFTQFI